MSNKPERPHSLPIVVVMVTLLLQEESADSHVILTTDGRARATGCYPRYCPGDRPSLTCTTTVTGVLRWSTSVTSRAPPFTTSASRVGDKYSLVNNTESLFDVVLDALDVGGDKRLVSTLMTRGDVLRYDGVTVRCSDNSADEGVFVIKQFSTPSSPLNGSSSVANVTCSGPQEVSVTVNWQADDPCEDPGLFYNVTSPQLGVLCPFVSGNQTSCHLANLSVNTSYVVLVRPVSCVGRGQYLQISVLIHAKAPDPVILDPPVFSEAYPLQFQITWKLPLAVAPLLPMGQVPFVSCAGTGCVVAVTSPTSAVVLGLTTNSSYTAAVSLRNCVGESEVVKTPPVWIESFAVKNMSQGKQNVVVLKFGDFYQNCSTDIIIEACKSSQRIVNSTTASCSEVATLLALVSSLPSFCLGLVAAGIVMCCVKYRCLIQGKRRRHEIRPEDNVAYGSKRCKSELRLYDEVHPHPFSADRLK